MLQHLFHDAGRQSVPAAKSRWKTAHLVAHCVRLLLSPGLLECMTPWECPRLLEDNSLS